MLYKLFLNDSWRTSRKINFSTGNRQKDTVTVELDGGKRIRIRAEYVCVPGDKSKTALNNHPLWHEMAAEEGIEKNAETSDSVGASAIDTYRGKVDPSSPEPIKFAPPVDLYLWYSNVTNRQVDSVLNLCADLDSLFLFFFASFLNCTLMFLGLCSHPP